METTEESRIPRRTCSTPASSIGSPSIRTLICLNIRSPSRPFYKVRFTPIDNFYLINKLFCHVCLCRDVTNLVMDIQRYINRVWTIFAEHFVNFEINCIQFIARAVISDNILANQSSNTKCFNSLLILFCINSIFSKQSVSRNHTLVALFSSKGTNR